jgi:hyperosmotically inducible protein
MHAKRWALTLISLSLIGGQAVLAEESAEKFANSQQQAPDNTSKNKRDKRLDKVTPENQALIKSDVTLTREVRKAIMHEKGMSIDAQNVKIITKDGVMTLRGPVNTQAEKDLIGKFAQESGAKEITNQLEPKNQ